MINLNGTSSSGGFEGDLRGYHGIKMRRRKGILEITTADVASLIWNMMKLYKIYRQNFGEFSNSTNHLEACIKGL